MKTCVIPKSGKSNSKHKKNETLCVIQHYLEYRGEAEEHSAVPYT